MTPTLPLKAKTITNRNGLPFESYDDNHQQIFQFPFVGRPWIYILVSLSVPPFLSFPSNVPLTVPYIIILSLNDFRWLIQNSLHMFSKLVDTEKKLLSFLVFSYFYFIWFPTLSASLMAIAGVTLYCPNISSPDVLPLCWPTCCASFHFFPSLLNNRYHSSFGTYIVIVILIY